jgi:RNA polymerase sigma-70 factor (ECF subfamily)
MPELQPDSAPTAGLLDRVQAGDADALGLLLDHHRPTLEAFVESHLDPRLRARLDASDVVQEAQLELARRMADFLRRRPMPFRLWACKTAYQRLLKARRDHRGAARRSVDREVPLPDRSSLLLAGSLLQGGPSPSKALERREFADRAGRAVAALAEADRGVLLLRHADGLSYEEIGCLLDIDPAAARKRYGRALIRLRASLARQGLLEGPS